MIYLALKEGGEIIELARFTAINRRPERFEAGKWVADNTLYSEIQDALFEDISDSEANAYVLQDRNNAVITSEI